MVIIIMITSNHSRMVRMTMLVMPVLLVRDCTCFAVCAY